jgi:hypothetical protein
LLVHLVGRGAGRIKVSWGFFAASARLIFALQAANCFELDQMDIGDGIAFSGAV